MDRLRTGVAPGDKGALLGVAGGTGPAVPQRAALDVGGLGGWGGPPPAWAWLLCGYRPREGGKHWLVLLLVGLVVGWGIWLALRPSRVLVLPVHGGLPVGGVGWPVMVVVGAVVVVAVVIVVVVLVVLACSC